MLDNKFCFKFIESEEIFFERISLMQIYPNRVSNFQNTQSNQLIALYTKNIKK